MPKECLRIENLKTYFHTSEGIVRAVDGVSLSIKEGETVGVVGESGCGKSMLAMSILRLISDPPGKIESGEIYFRGRDILKLPADEMLSIRGNSISMVFQEPMTSLNPVFTVGYQLIEPLMLHQRLNKRDAAKRAVELLELVRLPRAVELLDRYPHELSGGMKQRVMIAMAISGSPALLIADEPTTALDVTVQAQILDLMGSLKEKLNTSIMLITHDLGIVAEMCNHVAVMYAGKIVEEAEAGKIYRTPSHPYTRGLLQSKPTIDMDLVKLNFIPGQVPNPLKMPAGCHFHPRCGMATDICREASPVLREVNEGHRVSCWLYE